MKHRTTGERRIIIFFENRRDVHSGARRSRNNQNANAPPPLFLDQSRSCCICAAGLFPSPGQNIFLLSLVTESFRVSDSPIQRNVNNEGPWSPEQPSAFLFCCSLLRFYFICCRREDGGRTAALSQYFSIAFSPHADDDDKMKAESTFQTGIPTFRHDHLLIIFIATIFTTSNNSKIASAAAAAKISEVLRASLMTRPPHRAALDARIVTSVVAHLKLLRRQGRREGGDHK
jgi:hypothetical protein